MELTLLSGSWPPRPPQPPSPHAVLLVVPGMKSSVAVVRNVVSNVEHMGGQARLDPPALSSLALSPIKPNPHPDPRPESTLSLNCITLYNSHPPYTPNLTPSSSSL